jgi:hypothetical protein
MKPEIIGLLVFLASLLLLAFREEQTEKENDPQREKFISRYWKKNKGILAGWVAITIVMIAPNFVLEAEIYEYTAMSAVGNTAFVILLTIFWTTGQQKQKS